ncbi:facilitated trehalose transporter Tret1-like isoform X2 [Leguminivora glycinivorella]|uniref:facilitated trehalose transporter Tret1-like isoform X2 n=1 Tax=Leguminivora glycinivorella TaxID=1035111 RepID=UPI00200D1151|nr:facilitated trehalose transporter Tret1-like isoform X2 [Leguminivora glycinivorella]
MKTISPFLRQCLVTAAVSSSVIGCGCAFGFPGILLPQLEHPDSPLQVSADQASWLASVSSIPMICGNFMVPALMTHGGRKVALYVVILVMMLGWCTIIFAHSYELLLLGRILQGLSFGMFMPLRSIFIGECTSPRYRGGFLSTSTLAQTFGLLFVHLIGSLISYQMTALCSISFAIISLILAIISPESPSWLATKGQYDRCRKNFIWYRGEEEIPELEKMIQSVKLLETNKSTEQNKLKEIMSVATKREFYKPIFLMFALYILMTYSGGLIMGAYSVTILQLLLGPSINAHLWMVALDFQRLVFSIIAVYVINKVRRRTMLFSVGVLCASSQLAMGAYVYARTKGFLSFESLWIPGILINLQMLSVSMGMQPLPFVIAGEVFPLQYRGLGGSIGLVAQCGSVFIILKAFPSLIALAGLHGTYTVYSGVIIACLAVAWVLLPETSGRTLQQIEEHFRGAPLPDIEADVKESAPLNEKNSKDKRDSKTSQTIMSGSNGESVSLADTEPIGTVK